MGRGTLGSCCICPGTKWQGCRSAPGLFNWDKPLVPSPALTACSDITDAEECWVKVSFLALSCVLN